MTIVLYPGRRARVAAQPSVLAAPVRGLDVRVGDETPRGGYVAVVLDRDGSHALVREGDLVARPDDPAPGA